MNQIGDYVVCPGHGVGQITDIETRELGEESVSFYIIKIVANGMTVMIPTNKKDGIRDLVTTSEIDEMFHLLNDHEVKVDNSTWNRRYRDYMNKIKTGSILEIADVLRSLFLLKTTKNLSFGEKKMLDQCKELIVKEIALAQNKEEAPIHSQIDNCFQ